MPDRKKAVNLRVNADLLRAARDRGINLSATLERALERVLRADRRDAWLTQNREAIAAYNDQVEAHDAFSDVHRRF